MLMKMVGQDGHISVVRTLRGRKEGIGESQALGIHQHTKRQKSLPSRHVDQLQNVK